MVANKKENKKRHDSWGKSGANVKHQHRFYARCFRIHAVKIHVNFCQFLLKNVMLTFVSNIIITER